VDSVSLRDVGRNAGLTHGATYARYEDVNELFVDLWQSRLRGRALEILDQCARVVKTPNEDTVGDLIEYARRPEPRDVAMIEVLLTARRIPVVQEEVEEFVTTFLCLPELSTTESQREFTLKLALFALTIVAIFEEFYFGSESEYLDFLQEALLDAFRADSSDLDASVLGNVPHRREYVPDDDLRSRLTYSTALAVGKSGYGGATISRIARRVGCSPGAIYKIYSSKEELVLDAFRRIVGVQWIQDSRYPDILQAETISGLLLDEASDKNALRRNFTFETVLAAAHNMTLRPIVSENLKDPGGVIARLDVGDDEKGLLGDVTHAIASASKGVRWLTIITDRTKGLDFHEFSERLRSTLESKWARPTSEEVQSQSAAVSLLVASD
jgi:AcrR family transcriptional regulator